MLPKHGIYLKEPIVFHKRDYDRVTGEKLKALDLNKPYSVALDTHCKNL